MSDKVSISLSVRTAEAVRQLDMLAARAQAVRGQLNSLDGNFTGTPRTPIAPVLVDGANPASTAVGGGSTTGINPQKRSPTDIPAVVPGITPPGPADAGSKNDGKPRLPPRQRAKTAQVNHGVLAKMFKVETKRTGFEFGAFAEFGAGGLQLNGVRKLLGPAAGYAAVIFGSVKVGAAVGLAADRAAAQALLGGISVREAVVQSARQTVRGGLDSIGRAALAVGAVPASFAESFAQAGAVIATAFQPGLGTDEARRLALDEALDALDFTGRRKQAKANYLIAQTRIEIEANKLARERSADYADRLHGMGVPASVAELEEAVFNEVRQTALNTARREFLQKYPSAMHFSEAQARGGEK